MFCSPILVILETWLWRKRAHKVFRLPKPVVHATAGLAANQGLYNSFITAGIVYALSFDVPLATFLRFFTATAVVAGVFGALTASWIILPVQSGFGLIAFLLTTYAWDTETPAGTAIGWLVGASVLSAIMGYLIRRREHAAKVEASVNEPFAKNSTGDNTGH